MGSSKKKDKRRGKTAKFPQSETLKKWLGNNKDIIKFILIFVIFLSITYTITSIPHFNKMILRPINVKIAEASSILLNLLGENTTADGRNLTSNRCSLSLRHGCDGIHVTAIYLAGVFAVPRRLWMKIVGALLGILSIFFINLFRVVGLYYIRIYNSDYMETAHLYVFPAIIIILTLFLWLLWMEKSQSAAKA